eukprot:TRINITY_DN3583_c4_g1_i1.p1 TRINITY_DN3583_c4_g1~~TRINITY_DN3583_c4_g1_i1.p1  ORF type:complete len:183 (+),score=17.69 TRINITY_DN3583_c4_g1_i1:48-551(+)
MAIGCKQIIAVSCATLLFVLGIMHLVAYVSGSPYSASSTVSEFDETVRYTRGSGGGFETVASKRAEEVNCSTFAKYWFVIGFCLEFTIVSQICYFLFRGSFPASVVSLTGLYYVWFIVENILYYSTLSEPECTSYHDLAGYALNVSYAAVGVCGIVLFIVWSISIPS